jgi:hypothetical protein
MELERGCAPGVTRPSRSTSEEARPATASSLVFARALAGRDAEDYDAFVARVPSGHYAQARWWAEVACAGRPFRSSFVLGRDRDGRVVGAAHLLRASLGGLPLPYAIIERGPVLEHPALLRPFLEHLVRAARRRGILRMTIMPYWEDEAGASLARALVELGWRNVQTPDAAHVATLRLSAAGKSDEALFAGGGFARLRREISAAERTGARARRGTAADLPLFGELHGALMGRQGMHGKSAAWLRSLGKQDFGPQGKVGLFVAEHEGKAIAAALVIRHGRLVTYAFGASDPAPSRFSKMVPCLVAAIRWCRDVGCDFDLGGIPLADDPDPKRNSIAQFKRAFSQTRLALVGQHARWLL